MTEQELLLNIYILLLVLARVAGLFLVAPIFGSQALPHRIKIGLAFILALLLMPIIPSGGIQLPGPILLISIQISVELFLGLTMGFILMLIFNAVQVGGQFIDVMMGFAMANVMDPQSGIQAPLIGQFKNILATLLFLSIDGHHYLLRLLADSFYIVEINQFSSSSDFVLATLRVIGDFFPLAFRLALPVMAVLFIVNLGFGLVARTVPQLNIFIVGMPVKIFVALTFLAIILSNYLTSLEGIFMDIIERIYSIVELI
ncbi:flagellar biosynthetic protein FliR [Halonatronum saccharophilum]|uniref:flagellar biosynthetic protein FliR n=1 Tax=Halonatronum saccharophilum TaxID=150060 RepID=UPI0004805BB0|nr:flagellar biosynthetic protein FliR [Halonatronum saccharophilum]